MKLMFSLDGIAPLHPGLPSPFPQAVPGESKAYGAVWTLDVDRIEELGQMALEIDPPEVGMEEGHFTTCHIEVNTDDLWCVTFGWHALGEALDDPFDDDGPIDLLDGEEFLAAYEKLNGVQVPLIMGDEAGPGKLTGEVFVVDQLSVSMGDESGPEFAKIAADAYPVKLQAGPLGVPSPHWEMDTDA